MANRSTKKSLERFKYEVADGGYMVKKMIEAQERQMAGKGENIQ